MGILIFWMLCAVVGAWLATKKGRNAGSWFLICLITGFVGVIVLAFMSDAASAPAEDDTKDCPRCAEKIKAKALVCRFCGHPFEASAPGAPLTPTLDSAAAAVESGAVGVPTNNQRILGAVIVSFLVAGMAVFAILLLQGSP